jgi:hypothetical protein
LIFSPKLSLLDRFCFSKFRTEIENSLHPKTGAKMQCRLQETLCAQEGREKEQQSPGCGNAKDPESQPKQDRHPKSEPTAPPAPLDLGRPNVTDAGNILIIGSHNLLSLHRETKLLKQVFLCKVTNQL